MLTDDELDQVAARYTADPVPPCPVCGGRLSTQSAGGGKATVYGCSNKPEGVPYGEWLETHYNPSRWTQYRSGDHDVLHLVASYRSVRALADDWAAGGLMSRATAQDIYEALDPPSSPST